jgi:hypothetical protein
MADITPQTRILEDGTEELIQQGPDEDGVVYADLSGKIADSTETVIADEGKVSIVAPAAAAKPAAAPAKDAPAAEETDELPADLKGKTPSQLAKMYADAQALIGRQGQELGSYRNKFDQFLQADLAARTAAAKAAAAAKPAAETKPALSDDEEDAQVFAKPREAISKLIENHPLIKEIRDTLGKAAAEKTTAAMKTNEQKFAEAHPDAQEIVNDENFQEWVKKSPVRTALMQRAHKHYDFVAGNEVFETWKALQGVGKKPAVDTAAEEAAAASAAAATLAKRKATLKAAGVPTGGNAGQSAGAGAGKSGDGKPIYRRIDVLNMMENDPERYASMADEFAAAYAEKRVR